MVAYIEVGFASRGAGLPGQVLLERADSCTGLPHGGFGAAAGFLNALAGLPGLQLWVGGCDQTLAPPPWRPLGHSIGRAAEVLARG